MKLPDSRAFLIRLSDQADSATQPLVGRIEHIESGLRARFSSGEEMRDFIARILAQEAALEVEERPL